MKPKVITVTNQKGGVGKTTTAINLSAALAVARRKTLLLDFDPQGNASTGLNARQTENGDSFLDIILDDAHPQNIIVQDANIPELYILPADQNLAGFDSKFSDHTSRHHILKKQISKIIADRNFEFDFIVIDCPPSLNLLTINALTSAEHILVPMQCEYFSLEGLSQLKSTLDLIKSKLNPQLEMLGILLTMLDGRNKLSKEVEQEVRKIFGRKVFSTIIPRNVRLSEAPSHGLPALLYDHKCAGSHAYAELTGEILQILE